MAFFTHFSHFACEIIRIPTLILCAMSYYARLLLHFAEYGVKAGDS